jgi:hypothetical protein
VSRLLFVYPRAWRRRYGDELLALLDAEHPGGRLPWRVRLDVVRAGLAQRLGGNGASARRSGALLVLCAWSVFVVGGAVYQKVSEHWQADVPPADRALPSAAFDVVFVAALAGGALVLCGIALTAGPLSRFLCEGGWSQIGGPILAAVVASAATVALAAPVVVWAHRLSAAQRNGADGSYGAVVTVLFLCGLTALAACTRAAVMTARRLDLSPQILRAEALLAAAVAASMVAMIAATAVWWGAVARSAPHYFGPVPANMIVACTFMLVATTLGTAGAVRSLRA